MIPQGMTRLLYFHIPHFREVLLSSFSCDHCGHEDKSVRPAGKIQEKGSKYTLKVDNEKDLQRQIVRNDTAVLRIENLDLEMPTGGSELTNIEGTLLKISTELETGQASRKDHDPTLYEALQPIVEKLQRMMQDRSVPFTISIDDPSGNSFIEPLPTDTGPKYIRQDYLRSPSQNEALGLFIPEDPAPLDTTTTTSDPLDSSIVLDTVYTLHETCPACTAPCQVHVHKIDIPHFREVMIFATNCSSCGYRTSDVKTGGAVPERGRKITLQVLNVQDLSRDLLKSETCVLSCPELGLQVEPGTLGGRFTTVEGILVQFRDQLWGTVYDAEGKGEGVSGGDAMDEGTKKDWDVFFQKLDSALKLETTFSIVLEDPMANSYVQSLSDEDIDPQIRTEDYERTEDEKEDLGLNDMVLEGYEQV